MSPENNREIIQTLQAASLMPIFNHSDAGTWERIIASAYRVGIRVFEFSHQRDRKLQLFTHLVDTCREKFPDMKLGVGTVLDARTADQYLQAGAHFIASPFLREDMAEICLWHNRLWIPGCSTRQEIEKAREHEAQIISILPGTFLGANSLSVLLNEYPDMYFIPSGGIDTKHENLYRWLKAGALCIRMGLPIFPKEVVAIRDWTRIEQNLFTTLTTIKQIKETIAPVKNTEVLSVN